MATNAPVEKKVTAAALASLAVGIVVTVLNSLVGNSDLLGAMPAWAQVAVTLIGPPLVTFLAGWQAKHTPRSPTGV